MTFSRAAAARSLMSRLVSFVVLAVGVPACVQTPLTAPAGSAITFTAPTQASTDDVVTIDVVVLESKSAATPTTPTTPTNPGGGNQGVTNNGTTTAGGGTPVHDGTLVTFSSDKGDLSSTEARTSLGHATVTFTGNGATGDAKITATSGNITASHILKLVASTGTGG